jgi:hypothetical protein
MPDYQQGKIYKITGGDETYYGSTALTLKERMWAHKSNYNRWTNGVVDRKCACFNLFDKYGFDNCPIELVEDYPCETKKELLIREDWYMDNNECINEKSAYTSKEKALEQMRQRHHDHKEEANKKSRQRYLDHKEEALEQRRQYREEHKEEINEKQLQNYQANKEAILEKKKEKIVCECGRTICKSVIARHRKSAFHLANI